MPLLDNNSSGTQNLIGYADGLSADEMRQRLALSTRYLANWYKATKGSNNQDAWWQQIDTVRSKVETAYQMMLQPANLYFAGNAEVAAYNDAGSAWSDLYLRLTLSPDANQYGLLDQAADFVSTAIESPALFVTAVGGELGSAAGGLFGAAIGQFLSKTWPYILVAGGIGVVWIFRGPLSRLANKVA